MLPIHTKFVYNSIYIALVTFLLTKNKYVSRYTSISTLCESSKQEIRDPDPEHSLKLVPECLIAFSQ